jgi:uncharacterized protein
MKAEERGLRLSATDLSNFLACRHRNGLEMAAAAGKIRKPRFEDPQLEALFRRGLEHERAHVGALSSGGRNVVDLSEAPHHELAVERTLAAMHDAADVIVQAALAHGAWQGRPDVLVKVATPSPVFGGWSYEVEDTKLARETRAGAILQLGLYCELLALAQGVRPERFRIVTPIGTQEFRFDEFAAYFRWVRAGLETASQGDFEALLSETYPEPCDHCDICPWVSRCDERRRKDDHLSLVAGISRLQRRELAEREVHTLRALAELPLPLAFEPKHGAAKSYEKVREQARLQFESRGKEIPSFELVEVVADEGLCLLPEPTPGDVFLDLEGAPFAGEIGSGGREYLFGVVTLGAVGKPVYRAIWADSLAAEKRAFEELVDWIGRQRTAHPSAHVYHYAAYEPSALRRLMCRHATRENEIDALLRAGAFVDLYTVVRQSLRAGVERYSIKNLEPLYGYVREVDLEDARRHLQAMELALETDRFADLEPAVPRAVEGYNRDDCLSTVQLRDWLERLRADLVAKGAHVPRPHPREGAPSEALDERQRRVEALRARLREVDEPERRVLAYLLDFHRREDKSSWWEYFRLRDLPEEELLDEPAAVAGLRFVGKVRNVARSVVLRFSFPKQEIELRPGDELKLQEDQKKWAEVVRIDRNGQSLDVKVGPSRLNERPTAAFRHQHFDTKVIENALFSIGEGVANGDANPLAVKLLYARTSTSRDVSALPGSVLAIQGPPGSGKTWTGGTMICDLVAAGKKVGITATSHKVVQNLLRSIEHEAEVRKQRVRLGHKDEPDEGEPPSGVRFTNDNGEALSLIESGQIDVLGGTAWLWTRPEFVKSVDVLFIDEAGQMSLANALAVTQAAHGLVLLGDPQQLDQPRKGVHPDGIAVSALEHILGRNVKTMPPDRGIFLPETRRFGSNICAFTSEAFYERKLAPSRALDLERQALVGGPIDGAGLFLAEVAHEGNRSASDEEVEVIARLAERLLARGSKWIDDTGKAAQLEPAHVLVITPYNAQLARLAERLPERIEVGTVDKFQGRQAPVVIYSMATSSPELAPRGMEFLYSLNRLNVATSRAQCAAIVIASPSLFEPDCKSPGQMRLASALCRFREMATALAVEAKRPRAR